MIGLVVYISNKRNVSEKTFNINTLEEAKTELINYLALEFIKLNVDFPTNLNEFEYIWFDYYSMDHLDTIFNYNIYHNDLWTKPWEQQEIYDDILDKVIDLEINNGKNYNIDAYLSD